MPRNRVGLLVLAACLASGIARAAPAADSEAPSRYPTLAEIEARLRLAASRAPRIARVVDLSEEHGAPTTVEGHRIQVVKISDNVSRSENEPAILIMAGLHPRELVNPLIALDAIERLIAGYGDDPVLTEIVDANEIWIAPVWNPDGYEFVFATDDKWRKNRRPFKGGIGVDLNRNFPLGWDSECAGASSPASRFYKGPSPASERETVAMLAFTEEERFAKVLELHSPGREVLWGSACLEMPFEDYWGDRAAELSWALGFGGDTRKPSADGEHHTWQLARTGTLAFLAETQLQLQPSYEDALTEVERVWPGILWMLTQPISVSGRVSDACDDAPLTAAVHLSSAELDRGLWLQSGGRQGRYHAALPAGSYTLDFAADGYRAELLEVEISEDSAQVLDVALVPISSPSCHDSPPDHLPAGEDVPVWGCGCGSDESPSGLLPLLLACLWLRPRRHRA